MSPSHRRLLSGRAPVLLLALTLNLTWPLSARAQPAPAAPAAAASAAAPRPAASAPARAAAPAGRPASAPARATPGDTPQRIEITGGRNVDVEERRQSTAAKIVIGRDEIDKFGDATAGEVLRRLPGVSTPGPAGRGGPPRMRGLGSGYTQILIDGQRVAPGFSVESITPDQIERIEILRAPTAETGAQAIAGTINIITRQGFRRRLNDLRIGSGYENGHATPGVNWTHNDTAGDLTYNVSGGAFFPRRENSNSTRTAITNLASGALLEDRQLETVTKEKRYGMSLTSRLQWRLGDGGDQIALNPTIFHTEGSSDSRFAMAKSLVRTSSPSVYDRGDSNGDTRFTNARLGLQWRQRVGDVRMETNGTAGTFRSVNNSLRNEITDSGPSAGLRTIQEDSSARENSLNLVVKGSTSLGGNAAGAGEHNLVTGLELDVARRTETRTTLYNGRPLLADYGAQLQARSTRVAAYGQDEWTLAPGWTTQAGLRWEGITTVGDNAALGSTDPNPTNRSSVWAPVLHAVWKPDPKAQHQVRISLTRSYRPPQLGTLLARPSINRDYPDTSVRNVITSPDTVGNPALKPELARGIDLAIERYLEGGGVLSANIFHRQITDLMRNVTSLQTVGWAQVPRYVRQMQNIGDATTSGIEMDGKFRLDQLISGAPPVDLRNNIALYTSNVKVVPGPNNRLDQQARITANLGADYRMRGTPLTLGGNVNVVPGYTTRTDANQTIAVSNKRQWDAYVLYTFSPTMALRVLGNNLAPQDYTTTTALDAPGASGNERNTVTSVAPTYINWAVRLELKL